MLKGAIFTEGHKRNLSLAHKGLDNHQLGRNHALEAKLKIGLASKGNTYRRGKTLSEELKKRISETLKSHIPWNKGLTGEGWPEARRKAQEARNGKPYNTKAINTGKKLVAYRSRGNEYSPDWHLIRKRVYKRDYWTCQECGGHCHSTSRMRIQCHHIDYDISNNKMSNLITLCASCHCKTNFKRKDWVKHYKGLQMLPGKRS